MCEVLIPPYGGELVNLISDISEDLSTLRSIKLSPRNICDLELLATGAFSPLRTFMNKSDYESVLTSMRLSDGTFWPLPITLTVDEEAVPKLGSRIALRNANFDVLAVMIVDDVFEWSFEREALSAYGNLDIKHPMVVEMRSWGRYCISGKIKVKNLPKYHDFKDLRRTPKEVREILQSMGNKNVVAFQTRNPMHRAHEELTKRASKLANASLLIHPVVGLTKPGDIDHYIRTRCYKVLYEKYFDKETTLLSILPLAMRMAGPKEALLHAIIRRNFGANFFIVGRDHAGPGLNSKGNLFYGLYDAQTLVKTHESDIGIKMIPFNSIVYCPDLESYVEESDAPKDKATLNLSGTQVRNDYLYKGVSLPTWFTRPECAAILQASYPPRSKQGFCLWFTGLSGAGKSSIATFIVSRLLELYGRQTTLLDGDVVRMHLSKGLGFSPEDRRTNLMRIAFVSSEITRHGGAVIVAAISPYKTVREEARSIIGGNFIEIFVNTPSEVCEARDSKGLYAQARRALQEGKPMHFTGVDDVYEKPDSPEIELNAHDLDESACGEKVLRYLAEQGLLDTYK